MRNQSGLGIMGTAGLGAGLMFLLDPDLGTRRRAILRDKLVSFMRLAAWAADKTSRDLKNRVYGTVGLGHGIVSDFVLSLDGAGSETAQDSARSLQSRLDTLQDFLGRGIGHEYLEIIRPRAYAHRCQVELRKEFAATTARALACSNTSQAIRQE